MCGRFTLASQPKIIEYRFGVKSFRTAPWWKPNFNAAPEQLLPIITNEDPTAITFAQWGFVPDWDSKHKLSPQINARVETAKQRRTFRDAFDGRPCLVL